jgi:hypothetical protein
MVVAGKDMQRRAFAERLHEAIDLVKGAPPKERGRAPWLRDEFKNKFKVALSDQGVTKWLKGEAFPDQTHLTMICKITGANQQWLATGESPNWPESKPQPPRSALYSERELLLLQAFRNADPSLQIAAERVLDSGWRDDPQPNTGGVWQHASPAKK